MHRTPACARKYRTWAHANCIIWLGWSSSSFRLVDGVCRSRSTELKTLIMMNAVPSQCIHAAFQHLKQQRVGSE